MTSLYRTLTVAQIAITLVACGPSAAPGSPKAPQPPPSAAELLSAGPEASADLLSSFALANDAARVGAAVIAARSCPTGDAVCRSERIAQALSTFEASTGAIDLLVHQRAGLFPGWPRAVGPDETRICAALRLPCAPAAK